MSFGHGIGIGGFAQAWEASLHERLHRGILFLLFSLVLLFATLGIIGAKVYLDSGRFVMADISSSTGYLWKKGSCDELFRASLATPRSGRIPDEAGQLCDMARENHLPPLTLKTIIDSRLDNLGAGSGATRAIDTGKAQLLLRESKAELVRELPELKAFYESYQRRVSWMWLFIPALV